MSSKPEKKHITVHHIKLYEPTQTKRRELDKLLKNWNKAIRSALKIVKRWGFESFNSSHKHTYRVSRNNYGLPSQVAIEANRKVIETYKSAEDRYKANVQFRRTVEVTLVKGKSFSLIERDGRYFVKILTCDKRKIYCPLAFGEYQLNFIESPKYELKTAKLYKYSGEWYLDFIFAYGQEEREVQTYMGIDLGVVKLATISILDKQGKLLHRECANGKELRFKRMRYKNKRRVKARSAGSKATSLVAENRLCKELNFKIANRIIKLAGQHNSLIVFEDLKNIRKGITNDNALNNYEKNSWAFYQLKQLIKHKANLRGIPYVEVKAHNTSKRCSICGTKGYRFSQSLFACPKGHVHNADFNASANIAIKAMANIA